MITLFSRQNLHKTLDPFVFPRSSRKHLIPLFSQWIFHFPPNLVCVQSLPVSLCLCLCVWWCERECECVVGRESESGWLVGVKFYPSLCARASTPWHDLFVPFRTTNRTCRVKLLEGFTTILLNGKEKKRAKTEMI